MRLDANVFWSIQKITQEPLTKDGRHNYHRGMENETLKITVVEANTQQVLFQCALEDSDKAYAYAAILEKEGIDIIVKNPTLSDTLSSSLGLSAEAKAAYQASMDQELEEHEGSCCFEDQTQTKQ